MLDDLVKADGLLDKASNNLVDKYITYETADGKDTDRIDQARYNCCLFYTSRPIREPQPMRCRFG